MNELSFAKAVRKSVSKEFPCIIPSDHEYYCHPTIEIRSLTEFIRCITLISSTNKSSLYGETLAYRGIPDSEFDLRPGLARVKRRDPDLEAILINDFLSTRPDAFTGLGEFDTLAKMQHYGLPTRLLDFTLNPLIALYFACESKNTKHGRVLCHSTYLKNDSSEFVTAVCNASMKKSFDDNYSVEEYYCNDNLTIKRYFIEAYFIDETPLVKPKYWNKRIANQAGLFMVFPNNLVDRYYSILIHASEYGLETAIREFHRGRFDRKAIEEAIRREPIDYYKKNASNYLTDEYVKKMYDSYNNLDELFWDLIHGRFTIDSSIKPLSSKKISNKFCSIIIDPKHKKRILQDLSYIGFRADFIYPELEYTAQEIKRKVFIQ